MEVTVEKNVALEGEEFDANAILKMKASLLYFKEKSFSIKIVAEQMGFHIFSHPKKILVIESGNYSKRMS